MTEANRAFVPRDLRNLIALLFGGPFLAVALGLASLLLHGWYRVGVGTLSGFMLISYVERAKRVGTTRAFFIIMSWGAGVAVLALVEHGLALLASSGAFENGRSSHEYVNVQLCVSVLAVWLVIGIPDRAFQIRLDPDGEGNARAALLGVLVWTAAVLTGVNILMLHFRGGPLRSVNSSALAVGIIFTVVFAVPVYRFIATRCWERGIDGMFSSHRMIERWRKMLRELQAASDRAAKVGRKSHPKVDPVGPHTDKGVLDTAVGSAKNKNLPKPVATPATATTPHTSLRHGVSGKAARRARKKARKVGGAAVRSSS